MTNILLDTNILIYILQGNISVKEILDDRTWYISFISEMELQIKPGLTSKEKKSINSLLNECTIIEMNANIKSKAISNILQYKLKLADGIILATSQTNNLFLLTADSVFKKIAIETNDVLFIVP